MLYDWYVSYVALTFHVMLFRVGISLMLTRNLKKVIVD